MSEPITAPPIGPATTPFKAPRVRLVKDIKNTKDPKDSIPGAASHGKERKADVTRKVSNEKRQIG